MQSGLANASCFVTARLPRMPVRYVHVQVLSMPPRQAAVKQRPSAVLEGSEDQRGRDRGANRVEQLALAQPSIDRRAARTWSERRAAERLRARAGGSRSAKSFRLRLVAHIRQRESPVFI